MLIMLFNHPCIRMSQLRRHDKQGRAVLHKAAGVGMAQFMKGQDFQLGLFQGHTEVALLVRLGPKGAASLHEQAGVAGLQGGQFPVSRPGQQGGLHQGAEIRITGIDQTARFFVGQIAHPRRIDILEGLKLILKEVWGPAHVEDTAYLRVYVNQLRQKLEDDPASPKFLVTDPGVGYRLKCGE